MEENSDVINMINKVLRILFLRAFLMDLLSSLMLLKSATVAFLK